MFCNLGPLPSLQSLKKHMWRSVSYLLKITFCKRCFLRFVIRIMVPNRKSHHMLQIIIILSVENSEESGAQVVQKVAQLLLENVACIICRTRLNKLKVAIIYCHAKLYLIKP